MSTARFEMRIDADVKSQAEKASALLGHKSLAEYLVTLINEHAPKVIAEHDSLVVNDDIFDQFMKACEQAKKPNKKLQSAAKEYADRGFK